MSLFSFVAINGTLTVNAALPQNKSLTGHVSVTVLFFEPFEEQIQSKQNRLFKYKWNTDARSHSHCCRGKARSITDSERFCSFSYPVYTAHAPYCIVICDLSGSTMFFPHYLINGTIFWKKLLNTKCVFWFSVQLWSETFLILRIIYPGFTIIVHMSVCMWSGRYYRQILVKLEFCRQIFLKCSKYQISLKSAQLEQRCSLKTDGRIWRSEWSLSVI